MNKLKPTKNERELIKIIECFIGYMDIIMRQPGSHDRGKVIANTMNSFELRKDLIKQKLGMRLKNKD